MAQSAKVIVQRYRQGLRDKGMRPLQIWVPDTKREGFAEECRKQSAACVKLDACDRNLDTWMDQSAQDIEGWE